MNKLKLILLKHPTRFKYILLVLDIFFVLVATKMFINYTNIKQAIEETALQSQEQELKLAYTENFELNYEKSDYATTFLKHENNVLRPGEFIIKFQTINKPIMSGKQIQPKEYIIWNAQQSRIQFFREKLFPLQKQN